MMKPEIIDALAQFMQRVPLRGDEAPVWTLCMEALDEEMGKALKALESPEEAEQQPDLLEDRCSQPDHTP